MGYTLADTLGIVEEFYTIVAEQGDSDTFTSTVNTYLIKGWTMHGITYTCKGNAHQGMMRKIVTPVEIRDDIEEYLKELGFGRHIELYSESEKLGKWVLEDLLDLSNFIPWDFADFLKGDVKIYE